MQVQTLFHLHNAKPSMEYAPEIIVIAKDLHLKAELESLLNALGYELEVYGEFPSPEEFKTAGVFPDVLFMEVNQENFDKAEAIAKVANAQRKTPIIYLADNKEEGFFNKIKETRPFGFIVKPIDLGGIKRIVELAVGYDIDSISSATSDPSMYVQEGAQVVRKPFFFTKVGNKLRRIDLDDVVYIEVEGKYSSIQLKERKFHVKASLKDLLEKFPSDRFVRVSRNFVVNLDRIEHIDTMQYMVKVEDREIPVSRTYKEELMNRIQLL